MNEEWLEHACTFCFLSPSLFLSLSLPLTGEEGVREKKERMRERERERERKKREGGRIVKNCYFYF
jgi:hypothetical protein